MNDNFQKVLDDHTAGDPMQEDVRWTNLTQEQIAEGLAEAGTPVSVPVVKQLLDLHGFVRRKAQKFTAMGHHPDQDAQFRNIARLKDEFWGSNDPILSMDSKKKELIGPFFRPGTLYSREVVEVFDHDFKSFASGVVIPHGLYDLRHNVGHIHLGTSHDTGEFACDHLEAWWNEHGRLVYPEAKSILLLCDGGGSNSARHSLFKEDLQRLVDQLRVEIRVAHYPPYCSKGQPDRAPAVPARQTGVPGCDLRECGVGQVVDGESRDEHRAVGVGGDPGEAVPDQAEGGRGVQEGDEDRLR